MKLYSQHDPEYDRLLLGKSKLTIHGYGCFLCSIATFFQRNPQELLAVNGGVTADGLVVSKVLAAACGGAALPATQTPPDGWSIAMTEHYKPQGFPTHFFIVNAKAKLQIDPLDFPMKVEPLAYAVKEYRPFTGCALPAGNFSLPVQVFPDIEIGRWSEQDIKLCKEKGIVNGMADGLFHPTQPLSREEGAAIAARILRLLP